MKWKQVVAGILCGALLISGLSAWPGAAVSAAAAEEYSTVVHTNADEIYVSPNGSDNNPGTLTEPLKTIAAARDKVQSMNDDMERDIVVYLRGGNYVLDETLEFTEEDSGTNGHMITYKAYGDEAVSVSGGQQVTGWELFDEEKGIYSASFGKEVDTRQLYVNDKRATRARSTGGINGCVLDPGVSAGALGMTTSDIEMASWKNQESIEFSFVGAWTLPRCIAEKIEINPDNPKQAIITMAQPCWYNARNKGGSSVGSAPRWVENAYELLDAPGEWYLDKTGAIGGEAFTFYYKPLEGEDMYTAEVIVPVLEELLHIESSDIENPVSNLQFEGITFEHGTWLRPNTMGMVDAQNNYIREPQNGGDKATGGNIYLRATQNIVFNSCEFTRMGNAGIFMHQGNKDNLIVGCHFYDISAQAIQIGDVQYSDYRNFYLYTDAADASKNVTMDSWDWRWLQSNNDVLNNVIHDIGQEFYSSAAISAAVIEESDFIHNEIYNIPYSGFHIGYGWTSWKELISPMGNNRIQYNYIHECMLQQKDGGAIYTIGVQACATGEDGWARKSIISNNYILNQKNLYGSIYLDEGANYYEVYDNVIENTPMSFLTKHGRNYLHDNYYNQSYLQNQVGLWKEEGSARFENNTLFSGSQLPEEAQAIAAEAGVQEGYGHNQFSCAMTKGDMTVSYDQNLEYPLTVETSGLMNAREHDLLWLSVKGETLAGKEGKALINGEEVTGTGNEEGVLYFGKPIVVSDIAEILGKTGLTVSIQVPVPEGKSSLTVSWEKVTGDTTEILVSKSVSIYALPEELSEYDKVLDMDFAEYEIGAVMPGENPDKLIFSPDGNVKITVEESEEDGRFLRFSKTGNTSASYSASIPVTPATAGKTIIKYKGRAHQSNAKIYGFGVNTAAGGVMGVTFLHEGNRIVHEYGEMMYHDLGTYTVGEWQDITLILDFDNGTYDAVVDGQLTLEKIPMNELDDMQVQNLSFGMYSGHKGIFDMKDITVYTSRVPQATLLLEDVSGEDGLALKLTSSNVKNIPEGAKFQYRLTLPENTTGNVIFGDDAPVEVTEGIAVSAPFEPLAEGETKEVIVQLPQLENGTHTLKAELCYILDGTTYVLSVKELSKTITGEMKTVFEMDLSSYEAGKRFVENAENPLGILVTGESANNTVTVENVEGEKAILVKKADGSSVPGLEIPLAGVSGYIEVSVDIKGPESSAISYTLNLSNENEIAATGTDTLAQIFHRSGQIWHWNHSGGDVRDGAYDVNAWHNAKMVINPDKQTYDIYINGELRTADLAWRPGSTGVLTNLTSALYRGSNGSYYLKNLTVKATEVPQAENAEALQTKTTEKVIRETAETAAVETKTVSVKQPVYKAEALNVKAQSGAVLAANTAETTGFDSARAEYIRGLEEAGLGAYYIDLFRRISTGNRFDSAQYEEAMVQSDIMIRLLKEVNPEALEDPAAFDPEKFSEEQKIALENALAKLLEVLELYLCDHQLINNAFLNEDTEGYEAAAVEARIFDKNTHELLLTIRNDEGAVNWNLVESIEGMENLKATVKEGEAFTLPGTVQAIMSDGSKEVVAVVWDGTADTSKEGVYTFTGIVGDGEYPETLTFTLTVEKADTEEPGDKPEEPGNKPENPGDNPGDGGDNPGDGNKPGDGDTTTDGKTDDAPKTGDGFRAGVWILILGISVVGIIGCGFAVKKWQEKRS